MVQDPEAERSVLAQLAVLTARSPNASGLGGFIAEMADQRGHLGAFGGQLLASRRAGIEETAMLLAMTFELWASARLSGAVPNVD